MSTAGEVLQAGVRTLGLSVWTSSGSWTSRSSFRQRSSASLLNSRSALSGLRRSEHLCACDAGRQAASAVQILGTEHTPVPCSYHIMRYHSKLHKPVLWQLPDVPTDPKQQLVRAFAS